MPIMKAEKRLSVRWKYVDRNYSKRYDKKSCRSGLRTQKRTTDQIIRSIIKISAVGLFQTSLLRLVTQFMVISFIFL